MSLSFEQDRTLLARSVENAVFGALIRAQAEPEREEYWRNYADRIERKFINEYGAHPSVFSNRKVKE